MRDWKTTVSGIIAAVAGLVLWMPEYFPPWAADAAGFIAIGGVASLGITARQFNRSASGPTPQPKPANRPDPRV